jgi:asparagine synthase (glutamine-hydrolysing)
MCGIIGVFGHTDAVSLVKTGLAQLKERGKDGYGMATKNAVITNNLDDVPASSWALGHTLHAVVDHVPQPLREKGTLVANCEMYNWESLKKKYDLKGPNDAQVMLELLDNKGMSCIDEFDGVYAFGYLHDKKLHLARDLLGIKPLWYAFTTDAFAFCSEKKVLESLGFSDIKELHPRHVVVYDLKTHTVTSSQREFFSHLPESVEDTAQLQATTHQLLDAAIDKRIPHQSFGVLFSGGVDSTYIAHYLKKKGHTFTCYTAAIEGATPAQDLVWATRAAKELGFTLKVKTIPLDQVPAYLEKIIPLIEDSNVVKAGVALTFYLACELAKEDGCKVIFSGLGSEEIFAGYERHKKALDVNKECIYGLMKMYERDLYRDDVITMSQNLELRLPFLDHDLVQYALKIPANLKIIDGVTKHIFRTIAESAGVPDDFAWRKKTAAQYGSRVDNAIGKLAKKEKKSKSEYLRAFYPSHNLKLGVLFSGGKDSTYAAYIMKKQNYELTCLITMRSKNPESYMFHTPAIDVTTVQAKAMNIPLLVQETSGEKELELVDLDNAMQEAQKKYGIEGIVTGALFSTYQRDRIEKICDKLGLKVFSPLWHKPQPTQMQELLDQKFTIILTAVAGEGMNKSWLGRPLTQEDIVNLNQLHDKIGFNVAGEGGEFESLVLDCPMFMKKISIEYDIFMESENTGHIVVKKTELQDHSL